MTRARLLATLLLVPACDTEETTCGDAPVSATCGYELDSRGACLDEGGCWGTWGLTPDPSCNCPTTDAETPCVTDDDCEGLCIHDDMESDGSCAQPTEGACSDLQRVFGCFCTWQEGEGWVQLCAD